LGTKSNDRRKENLRKQNRLFWLLGFIFCSLVSLPVHAQPTRDFKEIKIAYPPSMASVTLMTAIKQRFFDEEGLRPVLLVLTSDLALKSQVAGEIDYTLFGGGSGFSPRRKGCQLKPFILRLISLISPWSRGLRSKASRSCAEKDRGQRLLRQRLFLYPRHAFQRRLGPG
jgi:hypothetical protein